MLTIADKVKMLGDKILAILVNQVANRYCSAPTSRRLIVVVQSPILFRAVGRNGEATFPNGPIIRSLPIA